MLHCFIDFCLNQGSVTRIGYDSYCDFAKHIVILLSRFAPVDVIEGMLDHWQNFDAQVAPMQNTSFELGSLCLWPCFAPERLISVLTSRSLSYHNAADVVNALPTNPWAWRREVEAGAEIIFLGSKATLQNILLLMITNQSAGFSEQEVETMLPAPGWFGCSNQHM